MSYYYAPIIVLIGKKSVGKTTAANYIKSQVKNSVELSFARPLKEMCKSLFLLSDEQMSDHEQKETRDDRWRVAPREILQQTGDLIRNNSNRISPFSRHKSIFTQNLIFRIKEVKNVPLIIVSDCRFIDEYEALLEEFHNVIPLHIIRKTNLEDEHISENGEFPNDIFTIVNDYGIENFYKELDKFLYKNFFNILRHSSSFL